ncbi:hypothetical protein F5879DRAFT_923893 [Lentinula edodes]|nr:hypothetical protein F5879DRAFT_923893 [Lentinula edodes]
MAGQYFYNEYDVREHRSRKQTHLPEPGHPPFLSSTPFTTQPTFSATETAFESPNIVSPLVSHPLPQKSLAEPKPPPITNINYEWQFLSKMQLHLQDLKGDPSRFWNPADIQFRGDLDKFPLDADLTSCLCDDSRNSIFMGHVEWLRESQRFIDRTLPMRKLSHTFSCKHIVVATALEEEVRTTQCQLEVEWVKRSQRKDIGQEYVHPTDTPIGDIDPENYVFFVAIVVAAILHIVCNVSLVPVGFLLGCMRIMLEVEGRAPQQTKAYIPEDMRTIINKLDLHPTYTSYVCCPKCFQLYDIDNYPELCNNKMALKSPPCKRRLRSASPASRNTPPVPLSLNAHDRRPQMTPRVIRQWKVPVPRESLIQNQNPSSISSSSMSTSLNIGNPSDSSDPELVAARQAFIQGQAKAYFKRLSSETIQTLAKEYGVQAFTPTGAPSKAKMILIDALFKWACFFPITDNNAGTKTVEPAFNAQSVQSETHASSHPSNFGPRAQNQSQAALSSAPAVVGSDAGLSVPDHDDYLKLFFSATKSQINRYPSKVLEGIAHAVKVWKETTARTHHRNHPSESCPPQNDTIPQNETDTFFETGSDGSLDYEPYDLDGYDMSDYQPGSDSDEEIEVMVPSDNQGKRNLIHDSEMEKSMFTRFCMMQRLKSLFHNEGFPPKVHSLVTLYQKSFENLDTRGTRINDALAFEDSSDPDPVDNWPSSSLTRLDAETYHRVLQYGTSGKLSTAVRTHSRFKRRGLTFTPDSRSFPDAQVIFSIESAEEWRAGSIKRIFTALWRSDGKPIGKTFAEIYPYKPLVASHAKYDKYRSFGFAGGRLFYDILEDEPLVLPLERISSHFGHSLLECFIDGTTIHALPLNKEVDFNI